MFCPTAAKDFISALLKVDQKQRPTATEALNLPVTPLICSVIQHLLIYLFLLQWVSSHKASTEHDISIGLRENFSARKQWQTAFSKVRAAGRLNAAAIMASQRRRDSEASAVTRASGGWKTIAGEDSDSDEVEYDSDLAQSPKGENIPSPSDTSEKFSPTSPEVAKGPERQEEMKPSVTDADAVKNIARAAAPTPIQTQLEETTLSSTTATHPSATPNTLPNIAVVSPTPTTPDQSLRPPNVSRSSSMPGSFNDEDEPVDEEEHNTDADPDGNGPEGGNGTTSTSPREETDIWGMATRMKKLMLG